MSRTLPQIIMLNHASHVNRKRMDKQLEKEKVERERQQQEEDKDPIVWNGKRLSEMTSPEWAAYYGDFDA